MFEQEVICKVDSLLLLRRFDIVVRLVGDHALQTSTMILVPLYLLTACCTTVYSVNSRLSSWRMEAACEKSGRWISAQQVLRQMNENALPPDRQALLVFCCNGMS